MTLACNAAITTSMIDVDYVVLFGAEISLAAVSQGCDAAVAIPTFDVGAFLFEPCPYAAFVYVVANSTNSTN
jgi:hypothetical protein